MCVLSYQGQAIEQTLRGPVFVVNSLQSLSRHTIKALGASATLSGWLSLPRLDQAFP